MLSPDTTVFLPRPKADALVAVLREWQRGAIGWDEALRRADLTDDQAGRLKNFRRGHDAAAFVALMFAAR
jgi:hypothetical protein